jgi:hypothetical protein
MRRNHDISPIEQLLPLQRLQQLLVAHKGRSSHRDLQLLVQIAEEDIAPRGLANPVQRHRPAQHRNILVNVLIDVRERYHMVILAIVIAAKVLQLFNYCDILDCA